MHEIDGSIRLEQIAPGALAGMRLAGNEQHAQPVAHALDHRHGAIVLKRDLAFKRLGDNLGNVLAAMIDHHRQLDRLSGLAP